MSNPTTIPKIDGYIKYIKIWEETSIYLMYSLSFILYIQYYIWRTNPNKVNPWETTYII